MTLREAKKKTIKEKGRKKTVKCRHLTISVLMSVHFERVRPAVSYFYIFCLLFFLSLSPLSRVEIGENNGDGEGKTERPGIEKDEEGEGRGREERTKDINI